MGLFRSNFFTIILLSIITFVVLDVNRNEFERSTTFSYLNKIGAAPYVNNTILTLKQSKWYNQYILPNWRSLARFFQPHINQFKTNFNKYSLKVTTWIQKNTASMIEYVDVTVVPSVKDLSSRYSILLQNYFQKISASTSEYALITSNWLNKNVLSNIPQDEIQKSFSNFVKNAQVVMTNSYEWASNQVQKLVS
ncbi:hypothetical protein RDWZM_008896 [Blomia tropicalis]|uniref:Uncharacterized protein n=1 Tax=Blomia tropicalis TaxID=40697 RepID=A0A9Q0M280_BLOTA|nr:hypothetical protein RDWZM_008896 [Blomia tropicalis]